VGNEGDEEPTGLEGRFGRPGEETALIPAATTVLLRDGSDGLEVLMVRRNSKLEFAGGMWVFPGGRIDPDDYPDGRVEPDDPEVVLAAARQAAVREAAEETGLVVEASTLVWFSHWTPPPITPKRFATWFFVAPAPTELAGLRVDGGEIHDHGWLDPHRTRQRRNAGEIEMAPPTWITLEQLAPYRSVDDAVRDLGSRPPEHFATRFASVPDGIVAMYHGDAGYHDEDPQRPGPRHRLWMLADGWRYEREPA